MKRDVCYLASLALIGAMAPATAFAGGVFFGFGAGAGNVDFDDGTIPDYLIVDDDQMVGEWLLGYRFDSKLIIEGGGSVGLSLSTLFFEDLVVLDDQRVMVGYAFQPTERFSIVPKVGVSFWNLQLDEIDFFSGTGLVHRNESGSDLLWRLSLEWRVAKRMHLYAAYSDAHYDFGDSSTPSFGFKFQF